MHTAQPILANLLAVASVSALGGFFSVARADDEASQVAYVSVAPYGRYYFKMIPDSQHVYDRDKGTGIAYMVSNDDGPDRELWRTTGWFASRTAIAHHGQYLVRIGNWPRGRKPSAQHLGIAFYNQGKLIRRYSTKDLLKGLPDPQPSTSHYRFIEEVVGWSPDDPHSFTIKLVGGRESTFDVRTGRLTGRRRPLP